MYQYAYLGEGTTIHSSGQLEMFKNDVNDKSLKVSGGLQRIKTQDGYVHPLDIKNGLPYIPIRPYTDAEWDTLPHVEWTSDMDWDPTVLDQSITDKETWYDTVSDLESLLIHSPFDEFGDFKEREADLHFFDVGEILASDDYGEIREPPDIDKASGIIFAHELQRKSTSPSMKYQKDSSVFSLFPTKIQPTSRDYESLRPFIRQWGAMDKLVSDRAQVEISNRVLNILRGYVIDSWQSETHYQHQNFAERRYATIKPLVNTLLNLTGAPAYCWIYIKFMSEIDPEPPPTFDHVDLLPSYAQYRIQDRNNDYVVRVGIYRRTIIDLEVFGRRHNFWTRYIGFKTLDKETMMLQMETNIISTNPEVDYGYIVILFLRSDSWKEYTVKYSDDNNIPGTNVIWGIYLHGNDYCFLWASEEFKKSSRKVIGVDNPEYDHTKYTSILTVPKNLIVWGEDLVFISSYRIYYWKIGSTRSRLIYRLIDTFIHDNLRSLWDREITSTIEVHPSVRSVTAVGSLHWRTPIEKLTGSTPDISSLLCFKFWEPVYYRIDDSDFPSDSTERLDHLVGISEHVGHALTFKVLTNDTKKVIHRSRICSAMDPKERNLRIDLEMDETSPEVVKSKHEEDLRNGKTMPTLDPTDLIGRTFLLPSVEDGQQFRGKIIEALVEHEENLVNEPERIKFRCTVNDEQYEEIVSYNEILNMIEKDETEEGLWRFKSITGHQGPLSKADKAYRGSIYNVLVNWETGKKIIYLNKRDGNVSKGLLNVKRDGTQRNKAQWKLLRMGLNLLLHELQQSKSLNCL